MFSEGERYPPVEFFLSVREFEIGLLEAKPSKKRVAVEHFTSWRALLLAGLFSTKQSAKTKLQ